MSANPYLVRLAGGDRRSLGCTAAIVSEVLRDEPAFTHLIAGMTDPDPVIAMRAADAAEKVSRHQPGWLTPHKDILIALILTCRQKELQWHLAMMMPRLPLQEPDRDIAETMLLRWLGSDSRIVQVEALTALAAIAAATPATQARLNRLLEGLADAPSPALRARVRRLRAAAARGKTV